jgi:hypothetical protein
MQELAQQMAQPAEALQALQARQAKDSRGIDLSRDTLLPQ